MMKKGFASLLFMCIFFMLNAQVTLEKTYDFSTSVVKFETLGYKYYLMDVPLAQCRIYNLDHSLLKTINCNVPAGFYLSDVKFLSEKLFDIDAGVELLCTFYKYNASPEYYEYDSKIINEDGSQLTFIDGALYNYINKTGENTYKLFSYCYDFSIWPEKVWTNIYNLPGTPVVSAFLQNENPDFNLKAFPNPTTGQVKVAYSLPTEIREGTLFLFDNNGRLVQQFTVDNHTDHLLLNVSDYRSGVYHYFVEYGNKRSPSQKLVVQ
jgi:hypothetical protein